MSETRVVLSRPADDGPGGFSVRVDGRKVATLGSGEKVAVVVPEGRHGLQLRFVHISSEPLTIDTGDGGRRAFEARRAFGSGPFDVRYLTRRRSAIAVTEI